MTSRVKRLLPVVLLVCLAVGCGSFASRNGAEIVLRPVPQRGEPLTPQGMQLAKNIISKRLDTLGGTEENSSSNLGRAAWSGSRSASADS